MTHALKYQHIPVKNYSPEVIEDNLNWTFLPPESCVRDWNLFPSFWDGKCGGKLERKIERKNGRLETVV